MVIAYIALGSNLGPREATLQAAADQLARLPVSRLLALAPFRETAPVEAPAGSAPFINSAAVLETSLTPTELLASLLAIEQRLGRDRAHAPQKNAPRTLDLDLLLHGDSILATSELTLPHPRMHTRRFVLEPLADIAPDARHPLLQLTVRELLAALPPRDAVEEAA